MASAIERKIQIFITILFLALLANGIVSYHATQILAANQQSVTHTYQVIVEIEGIMSTLKDAETGERGYIITGSDAYLQPYESALEQINSRVRRFESLTADNPRQQVRIPELEKKIAARLEGLKTGIDLRKSGDMEGARQLIQDGSGKAMMDDLRRYIDSLESEENRLLEQRAAESERSTRDTTYTFVIGNLIALGLLLTMGYLIQREVAARMRYEQELQGQRQLLEVTLSSIADAVIACDNQGLVTFMNPVAVNLTGWPEREARGKRLDTVFNIVNEETGQTVPNPALRAIREGVVVGLANHTVLKTKHGTEVPIDDSAAPLKTADGKLLGSVLVFRDITERRRSEQQLEHALEESSRARTRAETMNRMKDEFLATLSHELRTPLTAIYGWANLLQTRQMDEARVRKALEVISRNVEIETRLVDELLSVSKAVTGNLKLEMELSDPVPVIKAVIDSLRPTLETKSIELLTSIDENVGCLWIDPVRWQQVLWNLLSNAAKFTPAGGQVRIDFGRVDGCARLTVTDNGMGIDPAFLPFVFERFTQADSSATRRHGGLGLGLAIVRHIVELHGGTVSAASDGPGKGSTFTVELPVPAP